MTAALAVQEIKQRLEELGQALADENLRRARRLKRQLHNRLAELLVEFGPTLGLTGQEVVAFGGGTNKPPSEDEE